MKQARRAIAYLCAALLICVSLTSCFSIGTLWLASSSGRDPGDLLANPHVFREVGPAEGRSCRFFVLAIIPAGNSTFSRAMNKALQESGGDALLNVTTTTSLYGLAPLFNVISFTCTSVQGTAIKIEAIRD
jgi:hypothetical protein